MTSVLAACLIACLAFIALLAASEAALAAFNRVRLRHLLQTGTSDSDDQNVVQLLTSNLSGDVQRSIATVTIAGNMPLLLAASLTTLLVQRVLGPPSVWLTFVSVLVVVPFFKIVPRLLVSHRGGYERLWWVHPARLLVAIVRPPVAVMIWLGVRVLRPLGLFPPRPEGGDGDDERQGNAETIRDLVESVRVQGGGEESAKELFESIFEFGDTRASEVMVPRTAITALPVDAPPDKILDTLQETGFSRLPLYEESIDNVVGILHAKDVLGALSVPGDTLCAGSLMRPVVHVPDSRKIDEALTTMRSARTHLAIVIDEYGGTAGLLTVEDILEELVGEIADEHDRGSNEPLVVIDEHTVLVDATLHTEDLEDEWGLSLPTGEFDTVGGFMIEQLGRALVLGDTVELPAATLTVQNMRERRAHTIKIRRKPAKQTAQGVD